MKYNSFDTECTGSQKAIAIAMIATAFLTLWAYLYTPILDGDIWFHLLYGRFILESHTLILDHTIFTWTPSDNNTIYCAWIGHVLYYLLYKFTGYTGIIVLRYIAASTLFLAIFYLARQRNTLYNPITWFTATLCILAIGPATLDKPELLSLSLMTMLVLNWYKIKLSEKNIIYHIYLFPLLMLVWVNTHGAFIFGCIFLFCVGLGETINQLFYQKNGLPKKNYYHLCTALVLSAGATLITPYGYEYIQQLILAVFDKKLANDFSFVLSYMKTFDVNGLRMPLFAYTAVGLLVLVFVPSLRRKQLDLVPIISNLVFAFLFTRYTRSIYLWVPVFSLCVVYYAASITIINPLKKRLFVVTFALVSFTLSGWILYQEKCYPSKERWLDFGLCEIAAIDDEISFIQENFPNAKVGNVYDHGSYMLWKMWPKTKVMIDARYFPFRGWFKEYIDFEMGLNVETFIQKYPFDVIEIKHSSLSLLRWFHRSKEWKLAFYGKGAAVFVRSTLASPDQTSRGKSLENILAYGTALNVFNTTLEIKDWQGADIILTTMKRNFKCQHQQKRIAGLEYNKLATQAYDKKDYSASINFMEKAIEKKVVNQDLYAAALLHQSLGEWQEGQWDSSLKNAIKSQLVTNTFAAFYNVALMSQQMETIKGSNHFDSPTFTDKEREIATKWRETFKNIVQNKTQVPKQYLQCAENAENILNSNKGVKVEFIEPDWIEGQ
ncbi:MAG: hypothetical protein KJ990_10415 [Proteobacteria bacterium]|nr:hypothetical protein [Pseudomonadota bacterium]MBU1648814.1 hypothetical protein [Pseudomonadota bacterium]